MYHIIVHPDADEQIAELPSGALRALAAAFEAVETVPWNGEPQHVGNPDGAVQRWSFGPSDAGLMVYLVLEDQRQVHILTVLRLDF